MRARLALALVAAATAASGLPALTASASPAAAATADRSALGEFSPPFAEPGPRCRPDGRGGEVCQPAAVSAVPLANGEVLYWDGLEGIEHVEHSPVLEFGHVAGNGQSRVLDLRGGRPQFFTPFPADGGSNPGGNDNEYLPGPLHNNDNKANDGDLFCSAQVHLLDGRVLNAGGTAYYEEPGVSGAPVGVVELEGLKNSKTYHPAARTWSESGKMRYGRWYPTLVTLPDGRVFAASGVTKLVKPVYPSRPQDSGTNVKQTETYHPWSGTWTVNPASADKSLPLYPRLHLLPDGKVFYAAGGQVFNPAGQAYDEASWGAAAIYDPATQKWTDLDLPAFGPALKGFRGSGLSQMLTLKPPYHWAQVLAAGGVYGQTPGSYVATNTATLMTVDTARGGLFASEPVGTMAHARWYSTGVTLPTGQVLALSGADRDEVVAPGSGRPVTQVEMYDPATRRWSALASSRKGRTYHNTAVLLPDGRVLVGGHAPINTMYTRNDPTMHDHLGHSDPERDVSFEVYSPPYLFWGERPQIRDYQLSLGYGRSTRIETSHPGEIASVVLVRNPALTHLVDADQRVVELQVLSRDSSGVTVMTPPWAAVAPPGPYWLFVNRRTPKGLVPSVSRQVFVGTTAPSWVEKVLPPGATPKPTVRPTAKPDDDKGKKKGHDKECGKKGKCRGKDDDAPAAAPAPAPPTAPRSTSWPVQPVLPVGVGLALAGALAMLAASLRRPRRRPVRVIARRTPPSG